MCFRLTINLLETFTRLKWGKKKAGPKGPGFELNNPKIHLFQANHFSRCLKTVAAYFVVHDTRSSQISVLNRKMVQSFGKAIFLNVQDLSTLIINFQCYICCFRQFKSNLCLV